MSLHWLQGLEVRLARRLTQSELLDPDVSLLQIMIKA